MFRLGDKMDKNTANNVSPVVLAFIGDAVYTLFVRERLVFNSDYKSGELNRLATKEVNATSQAGFFQEIEPLLNNEELAIFKRGRNAKKPTKSKNASVVDYNVSTGLEALLGYLYIIGEYDRLNYLLNKGIEDED